MTLYQKNQVWNQFQSFCDWKQKIKYWLCLLLVPISLDAPYVVIVNVMIR
jgi:hypothetical protein